MPEKLSYEYLVFPIASGYFLALSLFGADFNVLD